MKKGKALSLNNVWTILVLLIFSLVFIFPLGMIILASIKTSTEVFSAPFSLPKDPQFNNFVEAWKSMNFPQAFLNNVVMTFFSIVGLVIFGSMAGYVCARNTSKTIKGVYLIFMSCIIVPFQTAMIPLVKLITTMQLINTYIGTIFVYIGLGMSLTVFLYSGFMRSIPLEIEEAARVDGCSRIITFIKIILPLSSPTTATVIILSALNIWNDMLIAMLLMSGETKRNLANALRSFQGQYANQWNLLFAGMILISLPVIVSYVFLQKYIIAGVSAGSVKG